MPELPEVETVRLALEPLVTGRAVASVRLSGAPLRSRKVGNLDRRLRGRAIAGIRRHGKYLLFDLAGGLTLLSHLGMSGRWLFFHRPRPEDGLRHVHARIRFTDRAELWFQDPRRFGALRVVRTERLSRDPSLAALGPDPLVAPPSGESLQERARGLGIAVKGFLMDQRRLAGIGNIYASEILHRAGIDPRRRAGALARGEWDAIAAETRTVLDEAIRAMGTTFEAYRTPWNEPGSYGRQLLVYDRAGGPCRRCGARIRRIVQGGRATFYCPACQGRRPSGRLRRTGSRRGPEPAA